MSTKEEIEQQLNEIQVELFKPISSSLLINKRKGSYTDLLDDLEELKVTVKNKGREFQFDEPIFLISAYFESTSNSAPSLHISYVDLLSKEKTVSKDNKSKEANILEAFVANVTTSLKFSPEGMTNFKEHLKKVTLIGIELSKLADLLTDVAAAEENLSQLKTQSELLLKKTLSEKDEVAKKNLEFDKKVDSLKAKISEDEKKISDLKSNIEELEDKESQQETKVGDLTTKINEMDSKLVGLDQREETVKNSVSQLETRRNELNAEIAKSDSRLKNLQNDINSYSENISDYIKEARKQSVIYSLLLGIALIVLGVLGIMLVSRINDLIEYYIGLNTITQGKTPAIDFLFLRAPMALILSFFIYLFAGVVNKLIQKIIHINDVKKELIAASIIAREVVESSAFNLELTSKEVYDLKEALKLDFLTHTMFSSHAEAAKESRTRRQGIIESLKLKVSEKISGTSIEAEIDNKGE